MTNSSKSFDEPRSPSRWRLDRDIVHAITHSDRSTGFSDRTPDELPCEAVPIDSVSAPDLAQLSGVSELEIGAMVDYGVLSPLSPGPGPWHFAARFVPILRRAQRLREDFAFDSDEFALALILIFELELVETELRFQSAARRPGTERATGNHRDKE